MKAPPPNTQHAFDGSGCSADTFHERPSLVMLEPRLTVETSVFRFSQGKLHFDEVDGTKATVGTFCRVNELQVHPISRRCMSCTYAHEYRVIAVALMEFRSCRVQGKATIQTGRYLIHGKGAKSWLGNNCRLKFETKPHLVTRTSSCCPHNLVARAPVL